MNLLPELKACDDLLDKISGQTEGWGVKYVDELRTRLAALIAGLEAVEKNAKTGETPRTDAKMVPGSMTHARADYTRADFARQLERELAAKSAEIERLKASLALYDSPRGFLGHIDSVMSEGLKLEAERDRLREEKASLEKLLEDGVSMSQRQHIDGEGIEWAKRGRDFLAAMAATTEGRG